MIARECTGDPGYPSYVSGMNELRVSRELPGEWDSGVSETIGLTRGGWKYTDSLCRFRSFTSTVEIHYFRTGLESMCCLNPAFCLLVADTLFLKDSLQAAVLYEVLGDLPGELGEGEKLMHPRVTTWALFARMLLAALHGDPVRVEEAVVLMEQDEAVTFCENEWGMETGDGPTLFLEQHFDQLDSLWADLTTWCLAPFLHLPVVGKLVAGLQPWRGMPLADSPELEGVNRECRKLLREMEALHPFKTRRRTWPLPPLGAQTRAAFHGRIL